jgi:hypothetical protein
MTLAVLLVLLIILLVLLVGLPILRGFMLPGRLASMTDVLYCFDQAQLMPGDVIQKTLNFHNDCACTRDYSLVFVQEGGIWNCNGEDHSLRYGASWSTDADQHLEPGETEQVTVTVTLPQVANNQCQGATGCLVVRRGFLIEGRDGGVYECRYSPFAKILWDVFAISGNLAGFVCFEGN